MSQRGGKSDRGVVPKKLPNKAVGAIPAAAKAVEERQRAKGNAIQQRMSRRSMRAYDMQTALDGIRQTARGRPEAKFTTLMNHIYQPERLEAAYFALKRDAAPGPDGQTWASYGEDLQGRLLDLSDRLGRGGYRPQPVKRVYIDKADGSKRPLGVPALEDKIVQRATIEVLNAIYEQKPETFDFLGFTHCCGTTRKGKFMVLRLTSAKRMRSKLHAIKDEMRRRMHRPIAEQGQYLRSVVAGHARYFAVPNNGQRVQAFRFQVVRIWHRTLKRRSQSKQLSWKRMSRIAAHWVPSPEICHPYPNQRLIVTTQGRSRMR